MRPIAVATVPKLDKKLIPKVKGARLGLAYMADMVSGDSRDCGGLDTAQRANTLTIYLDTPTGRVGIGSYPLCSTQESWLHVSEEKVLLAGFDRHSPCLSSSLHALWMMLEEGQSQERNNAGQHGIFVAGVVICQFHRSTKRDDTATHSNLRVSRKSG